ncbi:hypothetical protein ACJJTC_007347 [Scirpophaga incertulas]
MSEGVEWWCAGWGRWQARLALLLALPVMLTGLYGTNYVFLAAHTPYRYIGVYRPPVGGRTVHCPYYGCMIQLVHQQKQEPLRTGSRAISTTLIANNGNFTSRNVYLSPNNCPALCSTDNKIVMMLSEQLLTAKEFETRRLNITC